MKPSLPSKPPWPPIIDSAHLPFSTRFWQMIWFLWDYFSHPIFALTRDHSLDWLTFWDRIAGFVWLGLWFVIWISIMGIMRRKSIRHSWVTHEVPPLSLHEHAAHFGVTSNTVEQWRDHRIVVVEFDATNSIKSVTARLPEESV